MSHGIDGEVVRVDSSAQTPLVVEAVECPASCVVTPRNCYFPRERDAFDLEVDGVLRGPVELMLDEGLCF